jgi:hypothetical protein
MLRHAHTVLGAWIVLNVAAVPVAAQETLRDVVRRSGDTNTMVLREFSPMTLRDLVSGSDLTAHVLIRGRKSHVTADERNVVSQYTAQVLDVYMKADSTRKVGAEITIVRPGGSVILEGHQVQASEPDFPDFELGAEYVLFLKGTRDGYAVVGGAQGAFALETEQVEQMSRYNGAWKAAHGKMPLTKFVQMLADVKR